MTDHPEQAASGNDTRRLEDVLRKDPVIWRAMVEARALDLPDWWIVSGAIYNTVWNALSGRPPGTGIKDIDLFYFDPETSWAAEDRAIRRGLAHFTADPPVEIRNQARVHLWYKERFGGSVAPLRNGAESLENFASETHAVGARLDHDDKLEIIAPFGLRSVFEMRLVPNLRQINRETYDGKAARQRTIWPELAVAPWPDLAVVRSSRHTDWDGVLALLQRAFASMQGRIDPPSSLSSMDRDALAQKAERETCFIAHDGRAILGCVFCSRQEDELYVGKLAVEPSRHRSGIGRALMDAAEAEARTLGAHALALQSRIELTENHATFARMGFQASGTTMHPGFERPTSLSMRKELR